MCLSKVSRTSGPLHTRTAPSNLVEIQRILAQTPPMFVEIGPMLVEVGPKLAPDLWATINRTQPDLVKHGQTGSKQVGGT